MVIRWCGGELPAEVGLNGFHIRVGGGIVSVIP
jgi:hypothetical protein